MEISYFTNDSSVFLTREHILSIVGMIETQCHNVFKAGETTHKRQLHAFQKTLSSMQTSDNFCELSEI